MVTTIPIRLLQIENEGYHLLIKIKINRKVASAIVDTGASRSVFDSNQIVKYLKNENVQEHDKLSTGLGTNSMKSSIVVLKHLAIGELQLKNFKTVLLDLTHVNETYRVLGFPEIVGVIGGDILFQYQSTIDYKNGILKLRG
jgi:predicted aspartyl protease